MTDYQPLIARAVEGLGKSTGEARRALYERARSALVTQLRSVDPPLSESEITRERLSLEEAVRKVEAVAARKSRMEAIEARQQPPFEPRPLKPPRRPEEEEAKRREEESRRQQEEEAKRREEESRRQREEDAKRREEELRRQLEEEARQREEELRRQQEVEAKQREERRRKELLRPRRIRAKLAEMASPAPSVTSDGRLHAGPNRPYDLPTIDDDLSTLPIRQRRVIDAILSGLPNNAPKQLKRSLENYDDELKARGVQPIVGLLKDMTAIIEAELGAPSARREWLPEGLTAAFTRFAENHALFMKHFPLDPEREELYGLMSIDEDKASGRALSEPFEVVSKATRDANRAGLTTDDFRTIVDKLAEFAKVISTLPSSADQLLLASERDQPKQEVNNEIPKLLVIKEEDRIIPLIEPVSARKRALLTGFGFFERALALAGATATLVATEEGKALLEELRESIAALSKLAGL
jgi:hypothetical protein